MSESPNICIILIMLDVSFVNMYFDSFIVIAQSGLTD